MIIEHYCTECGTLLGEGDYIELTMCDECFDFQLFGLYGEEFNPLPGDKYDPDTG